MKTCLAVCSVIVVLAGCSHATSSGAASDIEATYRARQDSAKMRFTPADTRFMTGMMHHHAQAIEMSALAPSHGASAEVQTLAARITNSQRDEIAIMQRWLRDRGQPVPEIAATTASMSDMPGMAGMDHSAMSGASGSAMPGMLSPAQMRELDAARGARFDELFLRFMIQHHRGAITMVHELFATDGAAQDDVVFKFASDVQVDQTTEVTRMEKMLAKLLLK
jgi:uncharacterized protein (DUF305 family)